MRVTALIVGIALMMSAAAGAAAATASDTLSTQASASQYGATLDARTRVAYAAPLGPMHSATNVVSQPRTSAGTFAGATRFVFDPPQVQPYHPANVPLPKTRTLEDHVLTGFVALMLVAYQLRRKHKFLRPHRFSA